MEDFCIQIEGDISLFTPPDFESLTTWVLLEQEDWFENEIKFVRRIARPGMRAVDIGSNVGVYAITIAKHVSETGRVWAFEPASEPFARLSANIAKNELRNVIPIKKALSSTCGQMLLRLAGQSELNSLRGLPEADNSESICVSSLDNESDALNFGDVDFVKIDAEGEEERIIEGGREFLTTHSPLIMFEVQSRESGDQVSSATSNALRHLGYEIYRLCGPDSMLVPVTDSTSLGTSDINRFACKPDRALGLVKAGLLALTDSDLASDLSSGAELFRSSQYGAHFAKLTFRSEVYRRAFDSYATWRDVNNPTDKRYSALLNALVEGQHAIEEFPSTARLTTLSRIAYEASERHLATDAATKACGGFVEKGVLDEPFLPPSPRFDDLKPGQDLSTWIFAACVEAIEESRAYSGYFIPVEQQRLSILDWFQSTPFASAKMERRRQLQRIRARLQDGLKRNQALALKSVRNLNAHLWQ